MKRVTALLILGALAGCNSATEPGSPPAITGAIVAHDLTIPIGAPPTIHVKETPTDECGVIFLVRSGTRVLRRGSDGRVTNATAADLTVGRTVKVWANVVLDSCPGQSTATAVEIIDPPQQ